MTSPPPIFPTALPKSAVLPPRPAPLDWVSVLQKCGYPTTALLIDFECFFSDTYGMDKLSTIEYVASPEFEILGVAAIETHEEWDESVEFYAEENANNFIASITEKHGKCWDGLTVLGHNLPFDLTVLAYHYGIHPRHTIDTLDLSRHWNSRQKHDLGTLCTQFGLPAKGDTDEFKGLSFRPRWMKQKGRRSKCPIQRPLITPAQVSALADYATNDATQTLALAKILLPKLSNPTVEVQLMHHTLELFTRPTIKVDAEFAGKLQADFQTAMDEALGDAGIDGKTARSDIAFTGLLTDALIAAGDLVGQYTKITATGNRVYGLAKDDPQLQALLKHSDLSVVNLVKARVAAESWPLHISRVKEIAAQAACNGGYLPIPLKYYGGHLGRWAGGGGINLQNMPKLGILAKIREMLIADKGYTFVIVDAASIEARVTAWIAGQQDLVGQFHAGADIYCSFASTFYKIPVRKPRPNDIPVISKLMQDMRAFGKVVVLGCGFGMGAARLLEYAETQYGVIMTEAEAKAGVTAYRQMYPAIPAFWKAIDKAALYTAKYKEPTQLPRGIRFDSLPDCDLIMTLPNGREVKYQKIRVYEGRYGDAIEVYNHLLHKWEAMWGGVWTENCVQAMARDVLAEAMLRMEERMDPKQIIEDNLRARGYHTAFHCHDELVIPVMVENAAACLKAAEEEMSKTPIWAPGMPLGAEGFISERYRKG